MAGFELMSRAGVASRVAQAAMRHRDISLTMGTYTDARLLEISEAVESLSIFRNQSAGEATVNDRTHVTDQSGAAVADSVAPIVAPTVAPAQWQPCQKQSISVGSGVSARVRHGTSTGGGSFLGGGGVVASLPMVVPGSYRWPPLLAWSKREAISIKHRC